MTKYDKIFLWDVIKCTYYLFSKDFKTTQGDENMENQIELTKAIVVGVNDTTDEVFDYQIKEMINLCEAREIVVSQTIVQNLPSPNNKFYVGTGKVEEIRQAIDSSGATLVVTLSELSPVQLKNLSDALDCEVIDRTMLILEIFQMRAKTKEAILQVEIANLKYMLPRLVGSYTRLSRTGGGGGGGAGARRGSGETKLEEDRRHIEKRILKLTDELKEIVESRKVARKSRKATNTKVVAFVGYTNAGKSSTINSLLEMFDRSVDKKVFVKDMLFATLETSTRAIKLPTNQEFLITDTVGFVSNLPHHLVESFKSTLEEIKEADLIVHVVDASNPYAEKQIETTDQVLKEIGTKDIKEVYVLNKVDLVKNRLFLPKVEKDQIILSNETKEGFDDLIAYIKESLFHDALYATLLIPYDRGEVFNVLKEKAHIESFSYLDQGIVVACTMSPYLFNYYKNFIRKEE